MALSQQVEESLREAEGCLRNALAFAARNERPMVNTVIANLIQDIDRVIGIDDLMDTLDKMQSERKKN